MTKTDTNSRITYLSSLRSIRERSTEVYNLVKSDQLTYWTIVPDKLPHIINFCTELITRDFGTEYHTIPPHGRWRHFLVGGRDRISPLIKTWEEVDGKDRVEVCRRLVDLFVVAVLMDAGAGDEWRFVEPNEDESDTIFSSASDQPGKMAGVGIGRSEGLAVGTIHAFKRGRFSSEAEVRCQVDSNGLESLTTEDVANFMQSREGNQIVGLEGRKKLLNRLGSLLKDSNGFFTGEVGRGGLRPGNMVDYMMAHPDVKPLPRAVMRGEMVVPVDVLWEIVVDQSRGLGSIWPKEGRETIDGVCVGDVWRCEALEKHGGDGYVPFHKLSQWLTYSLIEVFENTLGWVFTGKEQMTGLPEYRNGGLLIDFDYLVPKPEAFLKSLSITSSSTEFDLLRDLPALPAGHPSIIEWRALTVICLDRIKDGINQKLGLTGSQGELSLVQVLEAATWKGGREVALKKRGKEGESSAGPPIKVISDGTIF